MRIKHLKGVAVGAGYFSDFQYEAWSRIPEVTITAICNRTEAKAREKASTYGIPRTYSDFVTMLDAEKPDFVDIITPPETHLEYCREASARGIHQICQKPLAPTLSEASQIVQAAQDAGIRFMVHENWRFQPWYRKIKELLESQMIGKLHYIYFRSRMGDGWGSNAYLPRQPFFREYPRLLVYENGIHFIDTFRYLAGDITGVYARTRRLNPVIKGEDMALIEFEFASGTVAVFDGNRYNEPNYPSPRYTFGEMLLEGDQGSLRLYGDGQITVQQLGEKEKEIPYEHQNINFCGDCVFSTQQHFVKCILRNTPFETHGGHYLRNIEIVEAVYKSADQRIPVSIPFTVD